MKNNKVMIYPSISGEQNKYISNLCKTIKDNYQIVGFQESRKVGQLFNANIYHFNWYESSNNKNIKIQYMKKKIFILILKMLNKKIIWTIHNNIPHEAVNKKQTIRFMKFMARKSDKIHILCKDTINNSYLSKMQKKIVYIPHGDYIDNYPKSNINIYKRYNIDLSKKIMLFIGQVRKYKNIELLINAFKESQLEQHDFILLICGKCNDEKYQNELLQIKNKNIFFDFNFIKDEEMEAYLNSAEIIVAPYNKDSSLNSGTLWMANSYKKTMMLPLIGCVKDIPNYKDFLYVYDYKNQNEHFVELLKCMKKLDDDLKNNKDILKQKGLKAYKYLSANQSWQSQKENWINLYKIC